MSDCLFCNIRDGKIPSEFIFEDEHCLAFRDINPTAPVHAIIIPRQHISTINDIGPEQGPILAGIWQAIPQVSQALGVSGSGYRVVANCNADGGQEIFHLHFHLVGGRKLSWPPG